jgi:hypothetical protein
MRFVVILYFLAMFRPLQCRPQGMNHRITERTSWVTVPYDGERTGYSNAEAMVPSH